MEWQGELRSCVTPVVRMTVNVSPIKAPVDIDVLSKLARGKYRPKLLTALR